MATNKLTATKVEKTRKPGMYGDGAGLYLRVSPEGAKSWVYRFMLNKRARWMGLGEYPLNSLAEAREKALAARKLQKDGTDPIDARRAQKAAQRIEAAKAMDFQACAEAYIAPHQAVWKHVSHLKQWKQSLADYVYPVVGKLPVAAIDTGLVMRCIEPLWATKTETMSRTRGRIESVLDWAKVRGYRTGENPARWRGHLDKLLPKKSKVAKAGHYTALPYADLPAFMGDLRGRAGTAARALEFLILTVGRTDEVRLARPGEFDLAGKLWAVPAGRMKGGREHRIPLSPRALDIVRETVEAGQPFVFARANGQALHKGAMDDEVKALAKATVHGMRSSFRDWAGDCTPFDRETIEFALAHGITDATEAAYGRSTAMEKRRQLMEAWANYCSRPIAESTVVVALRKG
jgi:integrase